MGRFRLISRLWKPADEAEPQLPPPARPAAPSQESDPAIEDQEPRTAQDTPAFPKSRAHRPLFDAAWYVATTPDLDLDVDSALEHFRTSGHANGFAPNPHRRQPIVFREPRPGDRHVIEQSGLFDADWYASEYGVDVEDALDDFMRVGVFLGCEPNPFFSVVEYVEAHPDVLHSGRNPLAHYIGFGLFEERKGALRYEFEGRFQYYEATWITGII